MTKKTEKNFLHPTLTPIPDNTMPNYNSLCVIQHELNTNAQYVLSNRGGGEFGVLALTIPALKEYMETAGMAFVMPVHLPTVIPELPAAATR